jgi:hypothetical protein
MQARQKNLVVLVVSLYDFVENQMVGKLKKLAAYLRGFLPKALPKGSLEFDQFTASILETYSIPDLPSYRNAIATMIMHLGPTTSFKSPYYFAVSIKKAMSNQVAYQKIQEYKKLEKELEEKRILEEQVAQQNQLAATVRGESLNGASDERRPS